VHVTIDDLWLCDDCLMVAVNDDASGLDYHYSPDEAEARLRAIEDGLTALGPDLVPDFDSETGDGIDYYSRVDCDCCGTNLHGQRHRFAVLDL